VLILACKLLITPFLIGAVTLAGRRWGALVSGLLIGLPLTSAPISFILACEYGLDFASRSAVGSLAGQMANCLFCLSYIGLSRSCGWLLSSLGALAAFFLATFALNLVAWELWPAFGVLLAVILLAAQLAPRHRLPPQPLVLPRWDLPARILTATGLVTLLTTVANTLGPQLSGLLSPFPAFSVIFAAFTHAQQDARSAANLLRGVIIGSGSYAAFFVIVGAVLPSLGIGASYLLASLVAMTISSVVYRLTRELKPPVND
jgi:hypothetical protein